MDRYVQRLSAALRAAACIGAVLLAYCAAALGSSNANWGQAVQATLPTGATINPYSLSLPAISCPGLGTCLAAGQYIDGAGHGEGVLLGESSGIWAPGIEAGLPANAGTDPSAGIVAVSCAAPGDCTAIGTYRDSAGYTEGFALSESSGVWGASTELTPPINAATNPNFEPTAISCPSAGNCTAVGSYADGAANRLVFVLDESAGTWGTALAPSLPLGAATHPGADLSSVSCFMPHSCTAVGDYSDSSSHFQGLMASESTGSWHPAVKAALPADAGANAGVLLQSVSCGSSGECVAVGHYLDAATNPRPLLLIQSAGLWAPAIEPKLPANTATAPNSVLSSVSCPAVGSCSAVGSYLDSSSRSDGLLLSQTGGTWATGVKATVPANANSSAAVELQSIDCASAGNCVALGEYDDSAMERQGLLLTQSAGSWGPGLEAGLPANAGTHPNVLLNAISCATAGNCSALGMYQDGSGNAQGLLVSAAAARPVLAMRAPAKGTTGKRLSLSATLSGGARPTGTVRLTVFGPRRRAPASCTSGGTPIGTATVSGDGTFKRGFTPRKPGRYWFYASYGGDVGNAPAASTCGGLMAKTQVLMPPPRTKITRAKVGHNAATFSFKAKGASGFGCALVRARHHGNVRFRRCHSPKRYKHLRHGRYVFEVRASSVSGQGAIARRRFSL